MAETKVHGIFPSYLPFGGAQLDNITIPKRKTPSDLRGEQLKASMFELATDAEVAPLLAHDRASNEGIDTVKKLDLSRNMKYRNTRLNDHFPIKKSSATCRVTYGLEKSKVSLKYGKAADADSPGCANNPFAASIHKEEAKTQSHKSGKSDSCHQSTLRSVAQLSTGKEKPSEHARIDVEKALKGMFARDLSVPTADFSDMSAYSSMLTRRSQNKYQISGSKIPLDFTLKSNMRLVLFSSVEWLHRLMSNGAWNDVEGFISRSCGNDKDSRFKDDLSRSPNILVRKALNSWKYPKSSLPSSTVTFMSSASTAELDFLKKRQQDWEDSFHNLYYMMRQNKCGVFYVETPQFVVLFVGGFSVSKRSCCNAYMSRSTRGLRSLLAENDVSFSMPLCHITTEQANADDLVELLEIDKDNLGQAQHSDLSLDVDNTPQSLLAFLGNKNVHALFDFLLNYRSLTTSLSSFDVPVLYSPVFFQNSSLFSPEVQCKEMKKADFFSPSGSDTDEMESFPNAGGTSVCHSIEIKGDILLPWVVSGICAAMAARSADFEASFTLEPKSVGLNIALDSPHRKQGADGSGVSGASVCPGVAETITVPWMQSASLRSVKFSDGSYTAYVSQL